MKNLLAAVTVLAVSTAQADIIYVDADCGSDCCSAHGTPGCDDPTCEAIVCDAFPPCCDVQWDADCVTVATVLCDPLCTESNGTEGFPYCSIQTAIDNAVDTDEIVVAPGTYFETIDFLGKAVTLHSSDGPQVTTIDAQQMNGYGLGLAGHPAAGSVVTCDSSEGADTVLEGFTITGGTGTSVEMILRGGGMYNVGSSPTVTNCTFSGNSASGAFTRGSGGGMYNLGSSPTVTNCSFSGNAAFSSGGGMYNGASSPTVTNCTFSGNIAIGFGAGGMHNGSGSPMVTNCILWNNCPNQISGDRTGVTYSNVQGGVLGTGNIDADPLFVDPGNGDFRLSAGSPCIDAGHNWAIVNLTDTDLDGNPRFADDPATEDSGCGIPVIVDMGAYEYQGVPATVVFADLNGDGIVTFMGDLMILNGCVGSDDPDCCVADLDLNGVVGMSDRILMWGQLIEFLPVR